MLRHPPTNILIGFLCPEFDWGLPVAKREDRWGFKHKAYQNLQANGWETACYAWAAEYGIA